MTTSNFQLHEKTARKHGERYRNCCVMQRNKIERPNRCADWDAALNFYSLL